MEEILESKEILEDVKNDEYLNKQWNIYKKENKYVDNIQFSEILKLLNKNSRYCTRIEYSIIFLNLL